MDSWERFNEKLLPSKKDFYSNLNMEDISILIIDIIIMCLKDLN